MAATYLYLNAALYAAFALWCRVVGSATSKATGYSVLTNSGESEYRVVYGGLQLGLAVVFAYLAARSTESHVGVMFAVT
ncbi:MAG: hypothetical protein ABIX37_00625 [Gammaproteobacteria bacterium]